MEWLTRLILAQKTGGSSPSSPTSVNGVKAAHLGWLRRFQAIVHMERLDGVRNSGDSSNLSWPTKFITS